MKAGISADMTGEINAPIQGGKRANHLSEKTTRQTCFPLYPTDHPAGSNGVSHQYPARRDTPGPSGGKNSATYKNSETKQEGVN